MKTLRLALAALGLLALAARANADFTSAQFRADNPLPAFPPVMLMDGITRGSVVVAVSVDEKGAIRDSLVLGYTNDHLVRALNDVLRDWRFAPAKLDGEAVPVQTELRVDFTAKGAVISTNLLDHFFFDNFDHLGGNAWRYEPARAASLDGRPVLLSGTQPTYAEQAEKAGVHGRVKVRFYINEQGEVCLPSIAGITHPYLAERAVEAVRSWKFQPPTSHGRRVLVLAQQDFEFGDGR